MKRISHYLIIDRLQLYFGGLRCWSLGLLGPFPVLCSYLEWPLIQLSVGYVEPYQKHLVHDVSSHPSSHSKHHHMLTK